MVKKIAIFGGTFDPPTLAHENIIKACLDQFEFNEIWVMPSGSRLDKPNMTSDIARLELLENMKKGTFAEDNRVIISDFELSLEKPTQTWHTIVALKTAYPSARFTYIFGADSYMDMHHWERGYWIARKVDLLLIDRVGNILPGVRDNIKYLNLSKVEDLPISSTMVRQTVLAGKPVDCMLSPSVQEYVYNYNLYRS